MTTTRPPTTMPAMAPADMRPPPAGGDCLLGGLPGAVVGGGTGVAEAAAPGPDAAKATTSLAAGASRRPSPTLGVGKWLAAAPPMDARCRTVPVAGLGPYRGPVWLMVQIRPAARI